MTKNINFLQAAFKIVVLVHPWTSSMGSVETPEKEEDKKSYMGSVLFIEPFSQKRMLLAHTWQGEKKKKTVSKAGGDSQERQHDTLLQSKFNQKFRLDWYNLFLLNSILKNKRVD